MSLLRGPFVSFVEALAQEVAEEKCSDRTGEAEHLGREPPSQGMERMRWSAKEICPLALLPPRFFAASPWKPALSSFSRDHEFKDCLL